MTWCHYGLYNSFPDSAVQSINNATFTAQSVFLSSEGYPLEMSSCGTTSGATCEVTASGTSTIRITGFDLQFSESSAECKQRLLITDNTSICDIACDDINDFARTTLYTSRSNSISIRLDNTATSGGGKFWIHLEGTYIKGCMGTGRNLFLYISLSPNTPSHFYFPSVLVIA